MKKDERFTKNVEVLGKSLTLLSNEDLNGRYAKSFRELQKEINSEANEIIRLWLIKPFRIYRDLTGLEENELMAYLRLITVSLEDIIKKEYDVDKFYEMLASTQKELVEWYIDHDGGFCLYDMDVAAGEEELLEKGA